MFRRGNATLPALLELISTDITPTLIIDEANLASTINDRTSEAKVDVVKDALSLFTSMTKERKKVSHISKCLPYTVLTGGFCTLSFDGGMHTHMYTDKCDTGVK